MLERILVAYDCSESGTKTFTFGVELAQKYGAELHVISVARLPEPPDMVETERIVEEATEHFQSCFKELEQLAAGWGVQPQFAIRVGHPAEQIIHRAAELSADAIVIGHRGHSLSFVERWLVGSVAKRVLTYAHCTVIVVR
ncbi:MAG: universal stress protein [Thermoleophilia bacterium]|jgi:nucleotide-binding universal stress UspA family protein